MRAFTRCLLEAILTQKTILLVFLPFHSSKNPPSLLVTDDIHKGMTVSTAFLKWGYLYIKVEVDLTMVIPQNLELRLPCRLSSQILLSQHINEVGCILMVSPLRLALQLTGMIEEAKLLRSIASCLSSHLNTNALPPLTQSVILERNRSRRGGDVIGLSFIAKFCL